MRNARNTPFEKDSKKIRNIGSVSSKWLQRIEVHTMEDLVKMGADEAYGRLLAAAHQADMDIYYSFVNAIEEFQLAAKDKRNASVKVQESEVFNLNIRH